MSGLPTPQVPISWGELVDKITILEIKARRLTSETALANVGRELAQLAAIEAQALARIPALAEVKARLLAVNEGLWEIEDDIRDEERARRFGDRFIELARAVYRRNDDRAGLKREINDLLGSELVEEKSYKPY
ncbi:MAG: hypothetical protein JWM33_163 [Caulobacteraceae bacterium]|nr:hypothetical protein [Caulobacteraceae bacterium]